VEGRINFLRNNAFDLRETDVKEAGATNSKLNARAGKEIFILENLWVK
jgi:hypothetical protein